MPSIAFIDSEIDFDTKKISDLGGVKDNDVIFHSPSPEDLVRFIQGSDFICGHNIFKHDLNYIQSAVKSANIHSDQIIDTLFWAPLLFPRKPYHALIKDDKLQSDDPNNPVNDSKQARDLFFSEISTFQNLEFSLQQIFYGLLHDKMEFAAFFNFLGLTAKVDELENLIFKLFNNEICHNAPLQSIISNHAMEFAYCLSLVHARDLFSITPRWITKSFPEVENVMRILRNNPCLKGCAYCDLALDAKRGLKKYFGFDSFREYENEPLQEKAAKAAIDHKSLLAVFPTGGGKSITFQVPALMAGENVKGLTVVISPLQSLMKDQVDNLEKAGIASAVTINGLLDPIERAKSFERVEDGSAFLLYISPELLRSKTIERLLLGRNVVRFVIDEAHCFSTWGQDFRVDYLYIAEFIRNLQISKNIDESIPVSCFTATAKPKVIEDICQYFKKELNLDLEVFNAKTKRENLKYKILAKGGKEEKYQGLRNLLDEKPCPTIVYVARTKNAKVLSERLNQDGYNTRPYHGKMDVKEKTANQEAFMEGIAQVMVATSAFGMGVDKKDIGMVVHYDISDSLENYVQEAGRAGRDENISALCYVLYDEDDLDKHFILLNQTKINIQEIKQVWKAIKVITETRDKVQQSALEIARKAGWSNSIQEIETRVTTAIAALEDAGYLKRGQNMPRIFANSILYRTAQEAIEKINTSAEFNNDKQKEHAVRIIKSLISSKRTTIDDEGETRIDYLSDRLGIGKEDVISAINSMREEGILGDMKDLSAFIKKGEVKNQSLTIATSYVALENFLFPFLEEEESSYSLKEINEKGNAEGLQGITIKRIKTILNYWSIKHLIKVVYRDKFKSHASVILALPKSEFRIKLDERHGITKAVLEILHNRAKQPSDQGKEEVLVEFSVHELKETVEKQSNLGKAVTIETIEDVLFFLSRIEAISIEGGFLVIYNKMTIERLEHEQNYKAEDYRKLKEYYDSKVQQIHIVGEYAKKMLEDYKEALFFVDDYFQLNYTSFLKKYFPGSRKDEIRRNITAKKYRQLFGDLNEVQSAIIQDKSSNCIVVTAGPGSGKTKVLVHKLAALLLMEDVKGEQLLMLTFSRAAANEFMSRLIELIGNAATYVEIKTFHSYCFSLLGRMGNLETSDAILETAIGAIRDKTVEGSLITKTVLVIDEAQDMDAREFEFVNLLIDQNPGIKVIAVGDEDQNIFGFRGSDSKYLQQLMNEREATQYELNINYRSGKNLVDFTNQFVQSIQSRLKTQSIISKRQDNGSIRIVHHSGNNLIHPLINSILDEDLIGSTCVLTHTNEEAYHIVSLLGRIGVKSRLIQSNEGFGLSNLMEVRGFLSLLNLENETVRIDRDSWNKANREFQLKYAGSSRLDICINLISTFERNYPKNMYVSDLKIFIQESKLEDFIHPSKEAVLVSTMHKSKGREFDNVYLLLENYNINSDEKKRQLYVAMTRAKNNLTIHLNGTYLDTYEAEQLEHRYDPNTYEKIQEIIVQLTHKDVQLGYFEHLQRQIDLLNSGDPVIIFDKGCLNYKREMIAKFSISFLEKLENYKAKGYRVKEAKINFIVYWQDEEKEYKIVLPELVMIKEGVSFP